ncbi:MAG: hypothetical protein ABJA71_15350 [Ginsengibacter sp.]
MVVQQEHSGNQQENEELRLENVQLKKDLEKEEFLHKTLYKQWNELNAQMLAKEREFNHFRLRNLFYKYAFYLILFTAAPAYYFISNSKKDEKIPIISQAVSSPPTVATKRATAVKPPDIKYEEKQIIQPDRIQQKLVIIYKPQVIVKPLTDSVRNLIYSEGWDAYYEKSGNPYQKSSQKYQVWLQGWKDAENDDKKTLTKKVNDTGENAVAN